MRQSSAQARPVVTTVLGLLLGLSILVLGGCDRNQHQGDIPEGTPTVVPPITATLAPEAGRGQGIPLLTR